MPQGTPRWAPYSTCRCNRRAAGLVEQRALVGRHHEQRHQVLEHRAAPARPATGPPRGGRQQPAEREPVLLRAGCPARSRRSWPGAPPTRANRRSSRRAAGRRRCSRSRAGGATGRRGTGDSGPRSSPQRSESFSMAVMRSAARGRCGDGISRFATLTSAMARGRPARASPRWRSLATSGSWALASRRRRQCVHLRAVVGISASGPAGSLANPSIVETAWSSGGSSSQGASRLSVDEVIAALAVEGAGPPGDVFIGVGAQAAGQLGRKRRRAPAAERSEWPSESDVELAPQLFDARADLGRRRDRGRAPLVFAGGDRSRRAGSF